MALHLAGIIPVIIVALVMLATSFVLLATHGTAASYHYDEIGQGPPAVPAPDVNDVIDDSDWNWEAMADAEGYVRVIFSYTGESNGALAAEANHGNTGLIARLEAGKMHEFSNAFAGFSGRVSLDDLDEALASPGLGMKVYPDLTVTMMLGDSVAQVGADVLWNMYDPSNERVTGAGVVVAVIDTGVDYTHPDLGGDIGPSYTVIGGYDFVNEDSDPMDDNGHGTHCAGVVAASGGITGVAPGASILAYKSLDASGQGLMSDVIAAIDLAMDPNQNGDTSDRADIISMSLGGPGEATDPVCVAVENAVAAGVIVVVAAGNSGPSLGTVGAPGIAPSALTVGAIDKSDELAHFSSRGTIPSLTIKPEISAPGVNIVSTVPFGGTSMSSPTGYFSASGTSMATPHVAGGAALLLQLHPTWTPAQIKSAIVTGAYSLDEPLWMAGAGGLWLPETADSEVFVSPAILSYGTAGDPSQSVSVYNSGPTAFAHTATVDWSSLLANGSVAPQVWTNVSSSSPYSLTLPSSTTTSVSLQVDAPPIQAPEGYYDGELQITSGTVSVTMPFGFAVLSRLTVTVTSMSGSEVKDPYGGVWVYRTPDCDVALGVRGSMIKTAPPATFLVPSGTYNVHSIGHQLIYDFSDTYALSAAVSVPRLSSLSVELSMADAHPMTIDLATDDGHPIYVKDLRIYFRYEGLRNVSFHITGSDYSVKGSDIFSIPTSKTVYVSNTDARVGISVSGFSYSAGMWEFMKLNWDHWFEYVSGADTAFLVEASTDLQYLLAWEFDGVGPSAPTTLGLVDGQYSVYETKYDIPGTLASYWCNWDTNRANGGDAAFFVRRDTDTSINPFFTGMTRTTVVQGVFSELYYPGNLFRGFIERTYYSPDYAHLLRANTAAEIYLPDRNFITPLAAESVSERIGVGPFWPALTTLNTDTSLVLVQPLLRDQSGAKVGGMSMPTMDLYRNGMIVGMYQFPEYLARPDALRVVDLTTSGEYMVKIDYTPFPQISNNVQMTLGFSVPGIDVNPPRLLGMEMAQRFVPGSSVGLTMRTADDVSSASVTVSWRPSSVSEWQPLSVSSLGAGVFSTAIPTSASDGEIHLLVRATDQTGNYLEFVMEDVALAQVPVTFELAPVSDQVAYRDSAVTVVLEGRLIDADGDPLSAIAGVPLELVVEGEKVGMILDEYIVGTTHVHNGDIRFEWKFNSAHLFASIGETVEVSVEFDLGIYEPVSRTFTLTSVEDTSMAPVVTLNSPEDGALIAPGEIIDLNIADDGMFSAQVSIDGDAYYDLFAPWDIITTDWADGVHTVEVYAVDEDDAATTAEYEFEVDGSPPTIVVARPIDGSQVPIGFEMEIEVSDDHLLSVTYSRDGGPIVGLEAPYRIDLTGWETGAHTVEFTAFDVLGNSASSSVQFEIINSTVVVVVVSPEFGAVVRPGTAIDIDIYCTGTPECTWYENSIPHTLLHPFDIDTSHWTEGLHAITLEASDDLGGEFEAYFEVVIDDTPPRIELVSPAFGSFVTSESFITVRSTDTNLQTVSWSIFGISSSSQSATNLISVASVTSEGYFSVAVSAVDLAGNSVQETFVFVMDLEDPNVDIAGVEPGGAILPGSTLTLSAQDTYISYFAWSLDGEPLVEATTPFEYSTEGLPAGWHQITIVAEDRAGRTAEKAVSFYIDDSPPTATMESEYEVEAGHDLIVCAIAIDDFGIGNGALHYESSDGGFDSIAMALQGAELTATIDADDLWDGMMIYIVVEDEAGNTFESDSAVVSVVPTSSALPGPDVADDGTESTGATSFGLEIILAICGVVAALLLMFVFMTSRKDHGRTSKSSRGPAPRPISVSARLSAARTGPRSRGHGAATARSSRTKRASGIRRAGLGRPALELHRMAADELSSEVIAQGIACAIEDQADEFDDVEKQLLSMISRGSVYSDVELAPDTVIDDDDRHRMPTVVSGLGLSRKMRNEFIKKDAS